MFNIRWKCYYATGSPAKNNENNKNMNMITLLLRFMKYLFFNCKEFIYAVF